MMIMLKKRLQKSSTANDDDDEVKVRERMPPSATSYYSLSKLGFVFKKLERDVDAINLVKPLFLISDKNLTAFLMCCVYLPSVVRHLASI